MALQPGTQLGQYEIASSLGVGGMGEVYRATDTKLGREVAIKVLPETLTGDAERLARFEGEARVLASLNHPGIATLHGFEAEGEVPFLIMELVEGETLADRIARGPIPIRQALALFVQIADGLEAAHERGVIHRDLKPANIKISPDGRVKILDFGLAKALDPVEPMSGSTVTGLSESPTMTLAATMRGEVLGTAAYMAPEQAKGLALDRRADVWAFGACLYEALTGVRAFEGDDAPEILGSVLKLDPDWEALPQDAGPLLRRLLLRCLEKNPANRLRDIADVRLDLQEAEAEPSEGSRTGAGASTGDERRLAPRLALAAVAGALVAGLAAWTLKPSPEAPRQIRRMTVPLGAGQTWSPSLGHRRVALSPDGTQLAYVAGFEGQNETFLRPLDQLEALAVPGGSGLLGVSFSADGEWLGVHRGDGDWKLPLAGGRPTQMTEVNLIRAGMSWSGNGDVFFSAGRTSGIWRVSAAGGEPEMLTEPGDGDVGHSWPHALPGGEAILFTATFPDESGRVEAYVMATGERRLVLEAASGALYAPSGHLVYTPSPDTGVVMAVAFDVDNLQTVGPSQTVLTDVVTDEGFGGAELAFSDDGTLAYIPRSAQSSLRRRLSWVDREGHETPLDLPFRDYGNLRVSPDGQRIVTHFGEDGGNADIHVLDLARGTVSKTTFDPTLDRIAVWSKDGRHLYFSSSRNGQAGIYRKRSDGTGATELVVPTGRGAGLEFPYSVNADGSEVLIGRISSETDFDVHLGSLDGQGSVSKPLIQEDFAEFNGSVSPDERWIAYSSDEGGPREVFVRPFPGLDGKWQVSTNGGDAAVWSPDGTEIFYAERAQAMGSGRLMRVAVVEAGDTFAVGTPEMLFEGEFILTGVTGRVYDIAPDGERFLVSRTVTEAGDAPGVGSIVIVENWFDELRRLVPTD